MMIVRLSFWIVDFFPMQPVMQINGIESQVFVDVAIQAPKALIAKACHESGIPRERDTSVSGARPPVSARHYPKAFAL